MRGIWHACRPPPATSSALLHLYILVRHCAIDCSNVHVMAVVVVVVACIACLLNVNVFDAPARACVRMGLELRQRFQLQVLFTYRPCVVHIMCAGHVYRSYLQAEGRASCDACMGRTVALGACR